MWIILAFSSALFAGLTSILAKCGIRRTDSNIATAVRTAVVLVFSWLMVFISGSQHELSTMTTRTWLFLILSGLATGASWLCYFRALQLGDVSRVVPIDKSSTVLTMLLALVIFKEGITPLKFLCLTAIAAGTFLMTAQPRSKRDSNPDDRSWLVFAVLSAVFASLTAILGKLGIENVDSNLATAVRTVVVLIMAWLVVFVTGRQAEIKKMPRSELGFIILSGFSTGASWLCYFRAMQLGDVSIVVPIDKLSIVVSIVFSYFVFGEKLSVKASSGLVLIVAGTLCMLI
jgi:transporter family protein